MVNRVTLWTNRYLHYTSTTVYLNQGFFLYYKFSDNFPVKYALINIKAQTINLYLKTQCVF